MRTADVVAVDLGASSGRVMLGHAGQDVLDLTEVSRFVNRPVQAAGTLYWDVLALYAGAVDGIRTAARATGRLDGVGVDSWAVDYGLLDRSGQLLGNPVHYRDHRTDGVMDKVVADLGADFLYERTGLQLLPINTIYQLASARGTAPLQVADRLLMIPDLVSFWLTGEGVGEVTNASTTGLLDIRTRRWSAEICDRLGVDVGLLPPVQEPGTQVGTLLAEAHHVAAATPVPVWAVGSHDTASAVVGVPARSERFAYISCGTWSLVGLELDHPVLTEDSRRANFTNELGVDGTRPLPAQRHGPLAAAGVAAHVGGRRRRRTARPAAARGGRRAGPEPADRPRRPGPAAARGHALAHRRRLPPARAAGAADTGRDGPVHPRQPGAGLPAHRAAGAELAGRQVDVVHLVGGGARNDLLCQLTADACGLPVEAGPVEAAALGNVLVQARAVGAVPAELAGMRDLLRRTQRIRRFEPSGSSTAWDDAERRLAADG